LRGFGATVIALPFFEEMVTSVSRAQDSEMPMRLITMFFGLGIPRDQMLEDFRGPLQPYEPLAGKMAIFRNLEHQHSHTFGSGEPHFKVGDVIFVGDPQKREYEASGPSIEQLVKRELHPDGVPTLIGSKSLGMWFRTGSVSQYTRHWNFDGSPGERPERRPTRIFEQFFGSGTGAVAPTDPDAAPDAADLRRQHLDRSVLDTVMDEYTYYTGDRSPLGADSKAKLSVHLDNIRGVEQRLVPVEAALDDALDQESSVCQVPEGVTDPGTDIPYDAAQGGSGASAPRVHWEDFSAAFQIQGELMALALRCDILRFGSMLFIGSGGHVGYEGTYSALGGSIDFGAELRGTSSHDSYFHNNRWDKVRLHQHLSQVNLAGVLQSFDDQNFLEPNGKSVLDNTLVIMATGYGGGGTTTGHNPDGVFHAIAGGNGHFKPGFYDQVYNIIDVYETALSPYGIASGMGAGNHPQYRYTPKIISEVLV
jgi:hypothetical protein